MSSVKLRLGSNIIACLDFLKKQNGKNNNIHEQIMLAQMASIFTNAYKILQAWRMDHDITDNAFIAAFDGKDIFNLYREHHIEHHEAVAIMLLRDAHSLHPYTGEAEDHDGSAIDPTSIKFVRGSNQMAYCDYIGMKRILLSMAHNAPQPEGP